MNDEMPPLSTRLINDIAALAPLRLLIDLFSDWQAFGGDFFLRRMARMAPIWKEGMAGGMPRM